MPKLGWVKAGMSTIGSSAVSTRQKNAIAETPQTAAQIATDVSCSHSYCGPSSSTYSSAPKKPAMKIRPHQSNRSSSASSGGSKSNSDTRPSEIITPDTPLLNQRQFHTHSSALYTAQVGTSADIK